MGRGLNARGVILAALLVTLGTGQALSRAGDESQAAGVQPLAALDTALEELAAQVSDSVVTITLERHLALPGRKPDEAEAVSLAVSLSGVVLDAEGTIVTLGRELERASRVSVVFVDGHTLSAKIIGFDPETSIGVLAVDPALAGGRLKAGRIGDATRLRRGSLVVAVGNPFGLRSSVSFGHVAGLDRTVNQGRVVFDNAIQITVPVNPGDPGGLLGNSRGELVGILSSSYRAADSGARWLLPPLEARGGLFGRGGDSEAHGINFALPIDFVLGIVSRLQAEGKVTRGWLGADVLAVSPRQLRRLGVHSGVLVLALHEGGPAVGADIKVHDVLVGWGEQVIENLEHLRRLVWDTRPGTVVRVKVVRDGESLEMEIELGERPKAGDSNAQSSAGEGER